MKGLGERIRQERQALELRLRTIVDRTGSMLRYLSRVERNLAAPSLCSLTLIAQAIGVDIGAIVSPGSAALVSSSSAWSISRAAPHLSFEQESPNRGCS